MEKEEKQRYFEIIDNMIKENKIYCNKYDMSTNLNMTILGQEIYILLSFENNMYLNISRFFHEFRTLYRRDRIK